MVHSKEKSHVTPKRAQTSKAQTRPMAAETPSVPPTWYFYNLKQSIDDPYKSFSEAALGSISGKFGDAAVKDPQAAIDLSEEETSKLKSLKVDDVPLYSQSTLRRTISPVTQWIPFNPGDTRRIQEEAVKNPSLPVAVGHERLMFEVFNESILKPIYWSIPYTTKVAKCHWVFSSTLTPIDPEWDQAIMSQYVNFIENLQSYQETMIKSLQEPANMKVIVQRLELKQAGKDLSVDLLFSPKNNNVYIFKADSSYAYSKGTAEALLNSNIPRGVLTILRPFDFQEYKELYQLPNRNSDDPNYVPLPINNLILVFHGVGQKLSNSYSRINFVYAIDKLRVEVQHATESPDVHKHFPGGAMESVRTLVLPVNWRSVFNTDSKVNVSAITVPSLSPLRQAFSDALLDIPLYMSENRRPDMLAAAASEANRLHSLVLAHHPTFAENGRTHIIGHSLGSLITADLLTHQPTLLDEKTIHEAPFKFQTTNYFTTGSMLGVFMLLKGEHLRSREAFDAENGGHSTSSNRPFGCFAIRNIYNIINQSDLLSFLVNATVEGAQQGEGEGLLGKHGRPMEADELPSAPLVSSGGLFSSGSSTSLSSLVSSSPEKEKQPDKKKEQQALLSPSSDTAAASTNSPSKSSSLSRFLSAPFFKSHKEEPDFEIVESHTEKEKPVEPPHEVKELLRKFVSLNENGQLDWLIPQTIGYIPSQYLKMFTAHFDYWSNKDLARFLAIECGRKLGVEHTVPEHRVKWTYKPGTQ